jgi:hypothetical protein
VRYLTSAPSLVYYPLLFFSTNRRGTLFFAHTLKQRCFRRNLSRISLAWLLRRLQGLRSGLFTTYRALQGTPTMETSRPPCTPLQSTTTAQWSPLPTRLSGATRGTRRPAGSRGFSGRLPGEKEAGRGTTRGGLSVM